MRALDDARIYLVNEVSSFSDANGGVVQHRWATSRAVQEDCIVILIERLMKPQHRRAVTSCCRISLRGEIMRLIHQLAKKHFVVLCLFGATAHAAPLAPNPYGPLSYPGLPLRVERGLFLLRGTGAPRVLCPPSAVPSDS